MNVKVGLVCLALAACGGGRAPAHRGVVWTDGEEPPRESARAGQRAGGGQSSSASSEPYVPHLRCNDGETAPDCSPNAMRGDCCVNQGGVYRDAWGNLVFE